MLQTATVEKRTLGLLKQLQSQPELSDFHLAGGTALALYSGRRKGIDLDLFAPYPFDTTHLEHSLVTKLGFRGDYSEQNTLKGCIDDVKIGCITHPYPLLQNPLGEEGIRLHSQPDIIAMKLSVMADNGSRLKGFIDIVYLSTQYFFQEMFGSYVQKFPTSSPPCPLKGTTYFDDIDHEETVAMLESTYSRQKIADRPQTMTAHQSRVSASSPPSPARKSPKIVVPSSSVQEQAQAILDVRQGQGSPALKTKQEVQSELKSFRHKLQSFCLSCQSRSLRVEKLYLCRERLLRGKNEQTMLLRVIVENFLSYRECQEFIMLPNRDTAELISHIFDKDTILLLKMASLYGNNVSDRSNFVQALSFIRLFALSETTIQSSDAAEHLYRLEQLDKLKESSPSILIEFKSNGPYFIYQVESDLQGVRTEQLLLSGADKTPESLYRRQYSNIELSPSLSSKSLDQWSHTKGTLEERLTQDPYKFMLGLLFEFPVLEEKHIKQAYDWFQQCLVITSGRASHNQLNVLLYESKSLYRFTSQVVRDVGTGVDDLRLRETDLAIWLNQYSDLVNTLDMSRQVEASETHSVALHSDRPILSRVNVAGKEKILELVLAHQGGDGNTYDLDIESEPDGTVRALHLMPALFEATDSFGVAVIDEMDTSLHSNLLSDLIVSPSFNPSKGQLIPTLHDTNLLDSIESLRIDEVWFIEKRVGSSCMYSLDNHTKKVSGDISQEYHEGRYGSNYTGDLV